MQCMHCGTVFDSRSGLRRHITEGRCTMFDPLASTQQCDVEAKWGQVLRSGFVSKRHLSAIQRLQLTTKCQLCGTGYDRQGDLVAHLIQSHGFAWKTSQPVLRFLIQVIQAEQGCQCNPQAHEVQHTHVCAVLRQLAMIFSLSSLDLMVPTQFDGPSLNSRLLHLQPDPRCGQLVQVLT